MNNLHYAAPDAVRDLYLQCVREHNRPDVTPQVRYDEDLRATAILDVVRAVWGTVAAGGIIMDGNRFADLTLKRPMHGGFFADLEKAA